MSITSFNSVGGFSVGDTGVEVVDANANVYGNLVSANIFSGDGGLLSNIQYANVAGSYGDANVELLLGSYSGNIDAGNVSTTGNISGDYIIGNGSQLTGLPAGYTDSDVANVLDSGNVVDILATGTVTANFFAGDGSQLSSLVYANIDGAYDDTNVAAYLANYSSALVGSSLSTTGNITANGQVSSHRLFAGSEDEPILINHSAVTTRGFISSIGAEYGSEMILHRHSTTQPVTLYGVISNSDTSSDGVVSNGMDLFSITGAGWTGTTYQNFAGISFLVDGANIADTSAPGAIHFWTTPEGSNVSANVMSLNHDGNLSVTGTITSNSNISGSYLLGNAAAVTGLATVAHTGDYANLANAPTIPTALSQLTNDANLVTWANVQSQLPSYSGNIGGTLSASYQPYITQLGQLTTLDINGGITIGGSMSVGGNTVLGNLFVTGNVDMPGNITVINANSYFSVGDAAGFNAFYAGLPVGFANLVQTVAEFSADYNDYAQVNFQNINGGNKATTDWVATADNGTDGTYYVDLGIASSSYDGSGANSLGNLIAPNDSYLYCVGEDAANVGGNLILATATESRKVIIGAGGGTTDYIVATFELGNASVFGNVNATGTITAASFTGDGSALTGIFSNTTLANVGSNAISTTGNISGAYLIGNGSQLTGLPSSYGNADVAAYLPTYAGNLAAALASVSGNVTANNIVSTRIVSRATAPSYANFGSLGTPNSTSVTVGINCNNSDQVNFSDTYDYLFVDNPTGTGFDGQKITLRFKSANAVISTYFDTNYRVIGTTLPATMTANKYTYIGMIYNSADALWDVVSVATQA